MHRMRRLAALTAAALALCAPAAHAGGFATAGLSSTPHGLRAGEPWRVDVTVLAHGRTPAVGLTPRLFLAGPDGARRAVAARATGRAGVYRATVTFPTAGRWRYALDDGYAGRRTTFPPVRIASVADTAAAGDAGPGAGWWAAGLAIAAGAGAAALRARRRRDGARVPA
jgi:hypothetical protein